MRLSLPLLLLLLTGCAPTPNELRQAARRYRDAADEAALQRDRGTASAYREHAAVLERQAAELDGSPDASRQH